MKFDRRLCSWTLLSCCAAMSCSSAPLHNSGDAGTAESAISADSTSDLSPVADSIALIALSRPILLAEAQACPIAIAVDQSALFWFNQGADPSVDPLRVHNGWTNGQVMKLPLDGRSSPLALASNRLSQYSPAPYLPFFSDGRSVFWGDLGAGSVSASYSVQVQLFSCDIAGGCGNGPTPLVAANVLAAAVDARNVYWTTGTEVDRCAIAGCSTVEPFASEGGPAGASIVIALDETTVYWTTSDGRIMACPKDGCAEPPREVKAGTPDIPQAMVIDGNSIYFIATDGRILSCAKTGCGSNPVTIVGSARLSGGIAIDGANMYWTEAGQGQTASGFLRRCVVNDCDNTIVNISDSIRNPHGVVVDGNNVYWVETGFFPDFAGNIWAAAK